MTIRLLELMNILRTVVETTVDIEAEPRELERELHCDSSMRIVIHSVLAGLCFAG